MTSDDSRSELRMGVRTQNSAALLQGLVVDCWFGDWNDDQFGAAGVMGKEPSTSTACLRAVISLTAVFALAWPSTATAEKLEDMAKRGGVHVLADGTSEKDMLNYTKGRIPWARMSPRSLQRASGVLNDLSQYRRMPGRQ